MSQMLIIAIGGLFLLCLQFRYTNAANWDQLIQDNNVTEIKRLLATDNRLVNEVDLDGWTPLHFATKYDNIAICIILLAAGSNVNERDYVSTDGLIPLHLATKSSSIYMSQLLISVGSNVNEASDEGWTPLHIASRFGNLEMCKLLIASGSIVNTADNNGGTSLHYASEYNHIEICKLLLASGVIINRADNDGKTALMMARENDYQDIIALLIEWTQSGEASATDSDYRQCVYVMGGTITVLFISYYLFGAIMIKKATTTKPQRNISGMKSISGNQDSDREVRKKISKRGKMQLNQQKIVSASGAVPSSTLPPLPQEDVPTSPQNQVKNFVSNIFRNESIPKKPHRNFVDPSSSVHDINIRSIINEPEVTTAIPLIGFDVSAALRLIMGIVEVPFSSRSKAVIAVVRGMGGGKTRALTEVRNALLQTEATIAIAVTFNDGMELIEDELDSSNCCNTNLIITVITRIISVVYDVDLSLVIHSMDYNLLPSHSFDLATQILREVLKYIVTDLRHYRKVDSVVVLVDETSRIEEMLMSKYQGSTANDYIACLRGAILSSFPGRQFDFKAALLLSCLTLTPIGRTFLSRAVSALVLPDRLDAYQIVSLLWDTSKYSEKEKNSLLLLAKCINNLPRLVEHAGIFIKNNLHKEVNNTYLSRLLCTLDEVLESQYVLDYFPSKTLLYNIIYARGNILNNEVKECVKRSVVTNSLKKFSANAEIIPETSIFPLGVAARSSHATYSNIISVAYSEMMQMLENSPDGGFVLDRYFIVWLKVRLLVAVCNPDVPLTLGGLLGFPVHLATYSHLKENILVFLMDKLQDLTEADYDFTHRFEETVPYCSYSDVENFVAYITTMPLNEVRGGAPEDAYDGTFRYFSLGFITDLQVFWEAECPVTVREGSIIKQKVYQYEHIKAIMDSHKKKFIYIYFTTSEGVCEYIADDCFIVNCDIASVFFGPVWEVVQSSCSSLTV